MSFTIDVTTEWKQTKTSQVILPGLVDVLDSLAADLQACKEKQAKQLLAAIPTYRTGNPVEKRQDLVLFLSEEIRGNQPPKTSTLDTSTLRSILLKHLEMLTGCLTVYNFNLFYQKIIDPFASLPQYADAAPILVSAEEISALRFDGLKEMRDEPDNAVLPYEIQKTTKETFIQALSSLKKG